MPTHQDGKNKPKNLEEPEKKQEAPKDDKPCLMV